MDVIGVYIYFVNQANSMVITCINSYCCTRINHTLSSLELVCLSCLHLLYSVENLNTGSLASLVSRHDFAHIVFGHHTFTGAAK